MSKLLSLDPCGAAPWRARRLHPIPEEGIETYTWMSLYPACIVNLLMMKKARQSIINFHIQSFTTRVILIDIQARILE